jgi:type II secretory pathway component PulF
VKMWRRGKETQTGGAPTARALSAKTRYAIYEQLAAYIAQGDTLVSAIEAAEDNYRRTKAGPLLREWAQGLKAGKPFARLVGGSLKTFEASLISAGHDASTRVADPKEGAAKLAGGFIEAAEVGRLLEKAKWTLLGALTMPVLLIFEVVFSLWQIGAYVAPVIAKLQKTLKTMDIPDITLSLMTADQVVGMVLPILGLILGGYTLFLGLTITRYTGPGRRLLDRLPGFAMFRAYHMAVAWLNFAVMYAGGNPVVDALAKATMMAPTPLQRDLDMLRLLVTQSTLADALKDPRAAVLLPAMVMRRIRAAAEAERLGEELPKITKSYITDLVVSARLAATSVGGVLTAISVANAIWVAMGMMALTGSLMSVQAF